MNKLYYIPVLFFIFSCQKEKALDFFCNNELAYFHEENTQGILELDFTKEISEIEEQIKETVFKRGDCELYNFVPIYFDVINKNFKKTEYSVPVDIVYKRTDCIKSIVCFSNQLSILINYNNEILFDGEIVQTHQIEKVIERNRLKAFTNPTFKIHLDFEPDNIISGDTLGLVFSKVMDFQTKAINERAIKNYNLPFCELSKTELTEITQSMKFRIVFFENMPPPPLPPENTNQDTTVYKIVEEMPFISSCKNILDKIERRKCSDERIINHIMNKIRAPRNDCIQNGGHTGLVVVRFIIEKDGSITFGKDSVLKGSECGMGEQAIKAIKSLPLWSPGKMNGSPVRVSFTVPIRVHWSE